MIPRYTPAELGVLWSSANRYAIWLEVELAACEAMEVAGLVPEGTARGIRGQNLVLDPARIDAIERTVKHDVIAFLTHVEELAGPEARWLHRGMTSSDVLDTSLAIQLVRAADLLLERTGALISALARRVEEHRSTPMIGRSHGMHAEPISFGLALSGHLAEMKRGRARLTSCRLTGATLVHHVNYLQSLVETCLHRSPLRADHHNSSRRQCVHQMGAVDFFPQRSPPWPGQAVFRRISGPLEVSLARVDAAE